MWGKIKRKDEVRFNSEYTFLSAAQPLNCAYSFFKTERGGLTDEEVEERFDEYGPNVLASQKIQNPVFLFLKGFANPFIAVLLVLAVISFYIDVVLADPVEKDWTSVIVISTMVLLSVILKFSQEWKSTKASAALKEYITNTASVFRNGSTTVSEEVDIKDLVPGDIIYLSAGDMIPADVRILESKDLFIGQSSLTGEANAIEKFSTLHDDDLEKRSVIDLENICYMGSNVISGYAIAVVVNTGGNTYFGTIAKTVNNIRTETAFDKGVNSVSFLLIRFMLVMVPFVFLVNGISKGDWFDAFMFAISIAVGLTPEMLPMIVTANLAKGSVTMAKKKTIVKNLNSIQNFGAMNILCTDKTGTLTRDQIILEKHLCVDGSEDKHGRVLRHAYFNSYFQTGLKNLIDRSILSFVTDHNYEEITKNYKKVDEIPFDFTRRRLSVVIEDTSGKKQIITKGAIEEMHEICTHVEFDGEVRDFTPELKAKALEISNEINREGMRVIGVAQKSWIEKDNDFDVEDEADMVLIGYLAFLDPPKPSAADAIEKLHEHGVDVKVLSGDNEAVVKTICRQVGIDTTHTLNGIQVEEMGDDLLKQELQRTTVFSKLTPIQKNRVIRLLQEEGNTVGFLGDGINDAAALKQADVGISVENAVDIAKESADIILLEKDLMVLEDGVLEGRLVFGNIMKYIKMTASSNFGNMFSVMAASIFLPFLPMLPIHILVQNLLYDTSQITIPFDRMDPEYLKVPRKWDAGDLKRFMLYIGPTSSIFDILTFAVLWYIFGYNSPDQQALFHSGWFIEGLISQTLIVHLIRTRKIPFLQSNATWPVSLLTAIVIIVGLVLPFSSVGHHIGLEPLPWEYFPWLIGILLGYCIFTQVVKDWYIRKFNQWL